MTDAEKEAAAAKRAEARAEAARLRSEAIEAQFVRDLAGLRNVPDEKRRIFDYIGKQIASGRREPEDVEFLRQTRAIHFRDCQRHSNRKEDKTDV